MLRVKLALIAWIFVGLQCKPAGSGSNIQATAAGNAPASCSATIDVKLEEIP